MSCDGESSQFWFQGRHGIGVRQYRDLRSNSGNLTQGLWAIVAEFDGPWHAWEVSSSHWCEDPSTCEIGLTAPEGGDAAPTWAAPPGPLWTSSLTQQRYQEQINVIKDTIANGDLEQVNLCRILSVDATPPPPARAVHSLIAPQHPAPYAGWFDFDYEPGPDVWLVSASPELAFSVTDGVLRTAPIKGTAPTASQLLEKDFTENRLVTQAVVDRMRCHGFEAEVVSDCAIEEHPGLVQLVSTVEAPVGNNRQNLDWPSLLSLLHPPLSVSGVPFPKSLDIVKNLEPTPRGPYCGAMGWIDVEAGEAQLGVVIRSFWWEGGVLHFGTGAGITAQSQAEGEWDETELKARGLIKLLEDRGR